MITYYEVWRYFDTYFDGVVGKTYSKEEAEKIKRKASNKLGPNKPHTRFAIKEFKIGTKPGEKCNRPQIIEKVYTQTCEGVMEDVREGSCTCFINPPCSYCTTEHVQCNTCGETYLIDGQ